MNEILTRKQVNVLRKAGRVGFYHRPSYGSIRVTERSGQRDIDHEEIRVESSVRAMREDALDVAKTHFASVCVYSDTAGDEARYWRTIAKILRAGDRLEMVWSKGYDQNPNLDAAGLIRDRLTLHVHRGGEKLTFIIPTPVCKNDTARTIKVGVYNNG